MVETVEAPARVGDAASGGVGLPILPGGQGEAPPPARSLRFGGLWRQPDFVRLWGAETVSAFGSQVSLLALPLIAALTLGASELQMGLLAAAGSAPFLVVGLVAGAWVDRLPRRPILIAADFGRAVLLLAVPIAAVADALSLGLLVAVAVAVGVLTVFYNVAYVAYLPALVRRDQLVDGNAKLQASASIAQVAGPGLGGGLVGLVTAPLAIGLDAVSFLASGLLLSRIRTAEPPPPPRSGQTRIWAEIGEGWRVVVGHPLLRAMAGCSATTNFSGFLFLSVYVLYLTRDLGLGATGVGLVFAVGGVGALIGATVAAPAARRFGTGPTMVAAQFLTGVTGLTVPLAVLFPAVALPMVLIAEFAQWLTLLVYDVNAMSLRQALAPERLRGRVNATARFLISGMQPIGSLAGGVLGALIGAPWTLVVGVVGMPCRSGGWCGRRCGRCGSSRRRWRTGRRAAPNPAPGPRVAAGSLHRPLRREGRRRSDDGNGARQ